ncbi:MAG: NFACT family protein, partial [Bacteroidota bacterium]
MLSRKQARFALLITNYYTFRALLDEWQSMAGYRLGDAYSQHRGELTLSFFRDDSEWSLRVGTAGAFPYVFRYEGHHRPRRNVTELFSSALDRRLEALRLADRDRFLRLILDDGTRLIVLPFGPRANVLHVAEDGRVMEAFRRNNELEGASAPVPSPAREMPSDAGALTGVMMDARGDLARRLSRAMPLFDRQMAREVCHRAGFDPSMSSLPEDIGPLLSAARTFVDELGRPHPRHYRSGRRVEHFALVPMHHLSDRFEEESFSTVDEAVRMFVRRRLGQAAFDRQYGPLRQALEKEEIGARMSLERMVEELSRPSRAEGYERNGHLLMAEMPEIAPGTDEVSVTDLFGDGSEIRIPIDAGLSAVENARRYYDRARRARQARENAEQRLDALMERHQRLEEMLEELTRLESPAELSAFQQRHSEMLARVRRSDTAQAEAAPFRRYDVDGYEVLVGRSARHNDRLTFDVARKFDLWLH